MTNTNSLVKAIQHTANNESLVNLLRLTSISYKNSFRNSKTITLTQVVNKIIVHSQEKLNITPKEGITAYRDLLAVLSRKSDIRNHSNLNIILTTSILILNSPQVSEHKDSKAIFNNIQSITHTFFNNFYI